MSFFNKFKKLDSIVYIVGIFAMSMMISTSAQSQTLRNPVLEFSTGTWCQWCPCGDSTVINQILPNIPNAIILAYHGPANTPSDPFSYYPGNGIISLLGLSAYPTGVVDRVSGVVNWNTTWTSTMNARSSVQATVSIDIDRSYNPITRELNATLNFTALQALSGEYRYSVILTEDGITWAQTSNNTCTPGTASIPNYVHEWLVREIINGVNGEMVINGTWNANETITKTLTHTVAVPQSPAPDIVPDSCNLVVLVYKQGTPLNSNAEIQQAEEFPLISPNYVAVMSAEQNDFLFYSSNTASGDAYIKNEGLLADKYYVTLNFDGPGGWTQTFTTVNGTFGLGEVDSIDVVPGDSTMITMEVNPNSVNGYGKAELEFWSKNSPSNFGSNVFRLATFGLDVLVVDDEDKDYEHYFTDELDVLGNEYGVVSASAASAAPADLHTFSKIIWMCANTKPTITEDDRNALSAYLDSGGNLYLSGLDIAYELADPASPYYSTATLEFFNNYLHSDYVQRSPNQLAAQGIDGDPISNGLGIIGLIGGSGASTVGPNSKPNEISPAANDPNAAASVGLLRTPPGPADSYCGVLSLHPGTSATGRVLLTTFGFETLSDAAKRSTIAERVIDWLSGPTAIDDDEPPAIANRFELKANYPNPFNPSTIISYVLPNSEGNDNVSLVIFNQLGQKVRTLVNETQPAGAHQATWNGLDDAGRGVASGVYFYKLQYGEHQATRKMLLLR